MTSVKNLMHSDNYGKWNNKSPTFGKKKNQLRSTPGDEIFSPTLFTSFYIISCIIQPSRSLSIRFVNIVLFKVE